MIEGRACDTRTRIQTRVSAIRTEPICYALYPPGNLVLCERSQTLSTEQPKHDLVRFFWFPGFCLTEDNRVQFSMIIVTNGCSILPYPGIVGRKKIQKDILRSSGGVGGEEGVGGRRKGRCSEKRWQKQHKSGAMEDGFEQEALKGLTCSCSADTMYVSGRGNGSHSRWAQQRPLSPPPERVNLRRLQTLGNGLVDHLLCFTTMQASQSVEKTKIYICIEGFQQTLLSKVHLSEEGETIHR